MDLTVKICGLRTPETLHAAIEAGADWVGFVFFPKSPRHVSLDEARALGPLVAGRAQKVALLVDAPDAMIADVIAALQPDFLQLHGHETPERVGEIKQRFGVPLIKAVGIAGQDDLIQARAYESVVDWMLYDAKPPKQAVLPGGNGVSFDWTLLKEAGKQHHFMLSGGLDADNVANALAITGAAGVDVSSGVESAPGIKDTKRIKAFMAAVRQSAIH
ncbi:MAG: phosphoribosylanthranilate isomerase [Rhizobiales bacterium]|jgi:phosphoribosylanthranilate isomerase|nr:phosphoribosylanthranilate isomerase [Hyphomicrobiales bacterium]